MTPLFVDSRIFGINQHLFQRFIFLLEGYNQVGNDVIEDLLQTANALRGMLKAYSSESDSMNRTGFVGDQAF